jgi:StAR-related lipid transfer protein 7, mitochondrial
MKILRSQSIWFAINEYFARNVKNKSDRILKFWIFQTESVLAQKLRQQQQKIALYMKIWEERALRELMQRFKKQVRNHCKLNNFLISKSILNGKKFMLIKSFTSPVVFYFQMQRNAKGFLLSSVGLCAFNWDSERINLNSIKHHFDEFDFINQLQKDTIYCNKCGKRKIINYLVEGIDYCNCTDKSSRTNSADGWEPYLERKNMITWRKEEKKGLYAYKVFVKYPDVKAEDFLFVQTDVEYRKKWDNTAVALDVVDVDPKFSNSQIVYWEMLWPKLFANRDYGTKI